MEKLKVKNFVVLKNAEIEIKKLNVIIGPQANGKSLLAKLTNFFKTIPNIFIQSIRTFDTKREFDKKILSKFEERFPRYSWEGSSFNILYVNGEISIAIDGKSNKKNKTTITLKYSENLTKTFNAKKATYKRKTEEHKLKAPEDDFLEDWSLVRNHITEPLRSEYSFFNGEPIFIPASRSFFANLQKNIFTFLASNLEIDPYLKDFGRIYEQSKRFYGEPYLIGRVDEAVANYSDIFETVVSGKYQYEDEQDWIVTKGRKINLANASSGQQESLPMLLVLMIWPVLRSNSVGDMYFIEEPEAHLFPTAQNKVISLLSKIQDHANNSYFITSHSPYILSAINNLILANDTISNGNMSLEDFVELNGPSSPISFEDTAAYTILDGVSTPIADPEYRMIGADLLDDISEHFEHVMNKMISSGSEQ
ncbi:AAA family ATPase [Pseudomonas sp. 13159349]|uniref:AAA family ATPase n=1 Tax=Pseudomonas sp. 13159349 TaxID=2662034 RepID=UPI001570C33E|nr:AAA family ATPase [Pseudomonas sp. 13159349]QKK96315.1 AAA family ATPase [Pseudomonas sp. 13159349]